MRGVLGIATLVVGGVIVANLTTNWKGVVAGGQVLNNILATSYAGMLGYNPIQTQQWPSSK
jgi:hypothetical protein